MTSLQNSNCSMSEHLLLSAEKESSSSTRKGQKTGDSPPLEVIVIRREEPMDCHAVPSSSRTRKSPIRRSSFKSTVSSSSLETSTSMFQLKPRNSFKTASSQGRKRSSASISPGIFSIEDSINNMKVTRDSGASRTLRGFPPQDSHCLESPGGLSSTIFHLNALSLRTPERNTCSYSINSHAAGYPSPPAFLDDGLAQNQMASNSSFTRYIGSPAVERSPTSPIDGSTWLRTPMAMGSPPGSVFSSPKTASLTVLSHDGRNYPTPTSFGQTLFLHANRCPSGLGDGSKILLPQRRWKESSGSNDSFSTVDVNCNDKASQRTEKACPGRLPLPRVALTPRCSGTLGSCLTRFPSPPRNDEMCGSFFLFESERKGNAQPKSMTDEKSIHQELKPHSFTQETACSTLEDHDFISFASLPNMPDVSRGLKRESSVEYPLERCCMADSQIAPGLQPRSRSLLTRSGSQNSIDLCCSEYGDDDNESLSFSEDEGAFFLVAPSSLRSNGLEEELPHKRMRSRPTNGSIGSHGAASFPHTNPATNNCSFDTEMVSSSACAGHLGEREISRDLITPPLTRHPILHPTPQS